MNFFSLYKRFFYLIFALIPMIFLLPIQASSTPDSITYYLQKPITNSEELNTCFAYYNSLRLEDVSLGKKNDVADFVEKIKVHSILLGEEDLFIKISIKLIYSSSYFDLDPRTCINAIKELQSFICSDDLWSECFEPFKLP